MKKEFKGFVAGALCTAMLTTGVAMAAPAGKQYVEVFMNRVQLQVNGQPVAGDNITYEGRTYLPLRSIAELLGKEVVYDADNLTVKIMDPADAEQDSLLGTVQVNTREMKSESKIFEEDIQFPVIKGLQNEAMQAKINEILEQDILSFRDNLKAEAEQDHQAAEGMELHPYAADVSFKVHCNRDNVLSLTVDYYSYTGGAHGMLDKVAYNFDLTMGERIGLADLFKSGYDYKSVATKAIKQQMAEDPDRYFQESIAEFTTISDDPLFYLEEDGLVFYFEPYEIAPWAGGIPEFKVSFIQFQDGLK